MTKERTFKVAVGDGFSGDVWHFSATDVAAATEQAQQKLNEGQYNGWSVINAREI